MKLKKAQRLYDEGYAVDVYRDDSWTRCQIIQPFGWNETKFRRAGAHLEVDNQNSLMKEYSNYKLKKVSAKKLEAKWKDNIGRLVNVNGKDKYIIDLPTLRKDGDRMFVELGITKTSTRGLCIDTKSKLYW